MPDIKDRVLLVDVCGTLYRANTTFDFLSWFYAADEDYQHFDQRRLQLWRRGLNRLLPGDGIRRSAILHLKGESRVSLESAARQFLGTLDEIDEVMDLVDQLRADHDRIVLLSSSLDFIVKTVCQMLNFDGFHASTLAYDGDVCLGQIERDLMGSKHKLIRREYSDSRCTLITDNFNDLACEAEVARFIAVAGDDRARRFWADRQPEVLSYR